MAFSCCADGGVCKARVLQISCHFVETYQSYVTLNVKGTEWGYCHLKVAVAPKKSKKSKFGQLSRAIHHSKEDSQLRVL